MLSSPVKQGQKILFNSQIKPTTSGNIALATATPATHSSCPVFTSQNKNSRSNSITEGIFAALPATPADQTLYDVVSNANVSDCKVSTHGDTQLVKNRLSSAYNPFLKDFSSLATLTLHPSALEPTLTIPKVLKTVEDLKISQNKEQKAAQIKAVIKDSMQQHPKSQKKIIKAIEPEAIFNFTKLVYISTNKETAFTSFTPHTTAFSSIPSRRYNSCDSSAYNLEALSSQHQ